MGDRKLDRAFCRFRDRGDVAALGEAFDFAAPELMRVARHLGRDATEAEDLVQATFLTALTKPQSYDERRRVLPWLLGILALHAREMRRKTGRSPDPDRLPERNSRDPLHDAEDSEFEAAVHRAVDGLPETYRGVLVAHLAEGLEPREVAGQFGLSPVAARVRLHRGMKLLRRSLPPGFALGGTVAEASTTGTLAGALSWPPPSGPVALESLAGVRAAILEEATQLVGPAGAAATLSTGVAGTGALARGLVALAGSALVVTGAVWFTGRDSTRGTEPVAIGVELAEATEAELPATSAPQRGATEDRNPAAEARWITGRIVDADTVMPLSRALITTFSGRQGETTIDGTFRMPRVQGDVGLEVQARGFAALRRALPPLGQDEETLELGDLPLPKGLSIAGSALLSEGPAGNGRVLISADFLDWVSLPGGLHGWAPLEQGHFSAPGRLAYSAARYAKVRSFPASGCDYLACVALDDPGPRGSVGWQRFLVRERGADPHLLQVHVPRAEALTVTLNGAEAPGLRVWAIPEPLESFARTAPDGSTLLPEPLEAVLSTLSDDRGTATFDALPFPSRGTTLRIGVLVPGLGPQELELEWGGAAMARRAHIDLAPPAEAEVLRGRVVDGTGRPLEGVHVSWIATASREASSGIESAPDGGFEIPLLTDGEARNLGLRFLATGYLESTVQAPTDEARRRGEWTVALTLDKQLGAAGRLAGRLVDSEGRSLVGIEVRLRGTSGSGSETIRSCFTEQGGRFELEPPAGERMLEVVLDGEKYLPLEPVLVDPGPGWFEQVAQVRPQGGTRVEIAVRGVDGLALDPGRAELVSLDGTAQGHPSSMVHLGPGHVHVQDLLPGSWRLWVAREPARSGYVDFQVSELEPLIKLDLLLGAPGSLEGRVLAAPGAPLPVGQELRLALLESPPPSSDLGTETWAGLQYELRWTLDAQGRFEAERLLPGRYLLELGPGGVHGTRILDVLPGSHPEIELATCTVTLLEVGVEHLPTQGFARLEAREADGTLRVGPVVDLAQLEGEGLELLVRPGSVSWTLHFLTSPLPGSKPTAAAQGGQLDLDPTTGKVAVQPEPLPPK